MTDLEAKKKRKQYRRSKTGCLRLLYYSMRNRVKYRKLYRGVKVYFSLPEFLKFAKTSKFNFYFEKWEASNYRHKFAPCIDRIDNKGHYSLDNIQIINVSENTTKGYYIDNPHRRNSPILQTKDGMVIKRWKSATTAGKELGIPRSTISNALARGTTMRNGIKWEYAEELTKLKREK